MANAEIKRLAWKAKSSKDRWLRVAFGWDSSVEELNAAGQQMRRDEAAYDVKRVGR